MQLIDSHAHLTNKALSVQVDDVMQRSHDAGVSHVITIGCDASDSKACVRLAKSRSDVYCSIGVHPHEAGKVADGDFDKLAALADEACVVAIGELGLDYHYDFSDRDSQMRVLNMQLAWAKELDYPLVIHCREAYDDTEAALIEHGFKDRPLVFHCFTGTEAEAGRIAANGWRISFTGIVTFKGSTELQAIARAYPDEHLMMETDSPYLSPTPVRHVRPNEPAHVAHTARFLAELRGVPFEVLAAQATRNTRAFFRLP
ncbi:MAG TPA: TatD family hydrolase [Phycisphaerae bacterium]|nr:TatD family hydrolase [Phycisphaerae bacterium]